MDRALEVVVLPVGDIDSSIACYRDKVGFDLDHDTTTEYMHVVQLTPRGSGCSIVFGDLPSQRDMAPGSPSSRPTTAARSSASATPMATYGAVQELKVRGEKPLIPVEHRGRFGA